MSCRGTLDRFGWKDWEIRRGRLYYNQLSYRYYWDPVCLVVPLYGVTDPAIIFQHIANNVMGIHGTRELQLADDAREDKALALTVLKSSAHNVYYVKLTMGRPILIDNLNRLNYIGELQSNWHVAYPRHFNLDLSNLN